MRIQEITAMNDSIEVDAIPGNIGDEGDEEFHEDIRTPSPPSVKRPTDRYQSKPEQRTRYQNGNDSRWQTPQGHAKPNSAKPPKSPEQ